MGVVPGLPAGPVSVGGGPGNQAGLAVTLWAPVSEEMSAMVSVKLALTPSTEALMTLCRNGVCIVVVCSAPWYSVETESPLLSVTVVEGNTGWRIPEKDTSPQVTVLPAMGTPLASLTLATMG